MKKISIVAWLVLLVSIGGNGSACWANSVSDNQDFLRLKKDAKRLLDQKDYQHSFMAYQELVRFAPADKEINLGLAWSASAVGRYSHAILAYERLIAAEPENAKYRLQLAHIHAFTGNKEDAVDELNEAKQYDPKITKEVEKRVLTEFSAQGTETIQAEQTHFFRGQAAIGVIYDTNANQGPNSNILKLGVFDNLVFDGVKKDPSWADYANIRVEGGLKSTQSPNLWLVGDMSIYQRWNFSSSMDNNNGFALGRVAAGVMYLDNNTIFDVRIKGEVGRQFHKESPNQNINAFGPEISVVYNFSPEWLLATRASYEKRSYTSPDLNNGDYWSVGQYIQKNFKSDKFSLQGGVRVFGRDVKDHDLGYNGWEVSGRGNYQISQNVELSPFVAYNEQDYKGTATALETEDRRDSQLRAGLNLTWDLTSTLALECGYQYVTNDSNSALHDYDQQIVNTGLVWKF